MSVPTDVLSERLQQELGGRRLVAAVLTTFTLERAFLLDEVVPTLVPAELSNVPAQRREELADHLHEQGSRLAVYYDERGLTDDAGGTRIPVSLVPVRPPAGFFHPKVVLALVEDDDDHVGQAQRLVVLVTSANLTRAGWFENVECAHAFTLRPGEATWNREPLLAFCTYLMTSHRTDGHGEALGRVVAYLEGLTQRRRRGSVDEPLAERFVWTGPGQPRGLVGQLTPWLLPWYDGGSLEVISPWYSPDGAAQIDELVRAFRPTRVLVACPVDAAGAHRLPEGCEVTLPEIAQWASLPGNVTRRAELTGATRRTLHAKAYRWVSADRWTSAVLVGSFNLTRPAFQRGLNVEAGVVLDVEADSRRKFDDWLARLEELPPPSAFGMEDESSEHGLRAAPLLVVYDWLTDRGTATWLAEPAPREVLLSNGGVPVLRLEARSAVAPLAAEQARALRDHLLSGTPVLTVTVTGEDENLLCVVSEENVHTKPAPTLQRRLADVVADLVLPPALRGGTDGGSGRPTEDEPDLDQHQDAEDHVPSVFDSDAALYRALSGLGEELLTAHAAGLPRPIAYRLTGGARQGLPHLLDVARAEADADPSARTTALVVCWAVEALLEQLRPVLRDHREDLDLVQARAADLRVLLERQLGPELAEFLAWARSRFLTPAEQL